MTLDEQWKLEYRLNHLAQMARSLTGKVQQAKIELNSLEIYLKVVNEQLTEFLRKEAEERNK